MDQHLNYLHNMLSKEAHRFHLILVKPSASTYLDGVNLVNKEYNSVGRQKRVKNHLALLSVDLVDANTDAAVALAKVYKRILSMSRQVSLSHGGDAHTIEFLCGAVIGFNWAKNHFHALTLKISRFNNFIRSWKFQFSWNEKVLLPPPSLQHQRWYRVWNKPQTMFYSMDKVRLLEQTTSRNCLQLSEKLASTVDRNLICLETVRNLSISVTPLQIESGSSVTRTNKTQDMLYSSISAAANLATLELMNVTVMMKTTQPCLRRLYWMKTPPDVRSNQTPV